MEEPTYQCPGEIDQISASVHRARLEADWPGCRDCVWNHQQDESPDGLPQRRRSRDHIQRTEYGIRGSYLNSIDRSKASLLASVFVSHLLATDFDNDRSIRNSAEEADEEGRSKPAAITAPPIGKIVVGYDTDRNSPDLFAGVVQAVRQAGADIFDVGCCTTASLQYSVGRFQAAGGLIVTSAESSSGEIGFDIFDRQGQAVSVPWQKYGIRVRLLRHQSNSPSAVAASKPERFAQHLRQQTDSKLNLASLPRTSMAAEDSGELLLPDLMEAKAAFPGRLRRSGRLQADSTETAYRDGLLKWWGPAGSAEPIELFCRNELVVARVEWLVSASSALIQIHEERLPEEAILAGGSHQRVCVEIRQDDRSLAIWSKAGRRLQPAELAEWLNRRLSRQLRHVTAHPIDQSRMIRLLDLAGPDSGESHSVTVDALAILGLLMSLNQDGRHPLPR